MTVAGIKLEGLLPAGIERTEDLLKAGKKEATVRHNVTKKKSFETKLEEDLSEVRLHLAIQEAAERSGISVEAGCALAKAALEEHGEADRA